VAHRTGLCLETKPAFKAEKAGSAMALPFLEVLKKGNGFFQSHVFMQRFSAS